TGGRIGKPVYSPVNGSVWRVKMSYNGYGKGLYIKGDDGHIYVFGHLSALSEKIDRTVKEAQNRAQRYYVDLNLLQDSIPIKKGEQIALSGQTGVGAPHLHFEKRSSNNQPLNPLEHGFKLNDKVRPTFERIGFQLTDDRSLFPDGSRTLRVDVVKAKAGLYSTDTVPYLSSPFGVLVDCFDQMRTGSMRQSIHRLTLSIDGRPVYESVFDSLKFEIGPSVQLEFDHVSAAAGEKRIRRLFHVPGNEYFGSGGESNGIIGADSSLSDGVHEGLIEAEDSFGNKARLEFRFMWGPEGESRSESADLGVRETQSLGYTLLDQGLVLSLDGGSDKDSVGRVMVHYRNTAGSPGGIGGSRGWAVTPASAGHVFVTCQSIYNQVHYVEVSPDFRRPHQSPFGVKVNVSAVGYQDHTMLSNDSLFSVHTTRETFYEPRFLALENAEAPATPGLVSNCYRILPDAFVTTQPFEVELKVDPKAIGVRSKQAGLCWRDEKENEWVWINEFYEDDTTSGLTTSAVPPEPRGYYPSGTSLGGGMFAVLI
ncbi:MAG: M23 family metallopeptidase, partial [bacterium]|nr:M23 family metallopeptidase [bacterium]